MVIEGEGKAKPDAMAIGSREWTVQISPVDRPLGKNGKGKRNLENAMRRSPMSLALGHGGDLYGGKRG